MVCDMMMLLHNYEIRYVIVPLIPIQMMHDIAFGNIRERRVAF